MPDFAAMSYEELLRQDGHPCSCGKCHKAPLRYLRIESGAVRYLPDALRTLNFAKPFVVADPNTYEAAGKQVEAILKEAGIPYVLYVFGIPFGSHMEPDEKAVGAVTMHYEPDCDVILAVGSGVINDICKVVGHCAGKPTMVVGTAPSMDGYASNSSSMISDGVKVSFYNACPIAIICDLDIMKNAPMRMLMAGLGDVLAKCIAIADWKMARVVVDEPYCESIADLMRHCVKQCLDNAEGLIRRDAQAVGKVVEGLILSGVAMSFHGSSRPASGLEHYFSHIWEMITLQRGKETELHGIQVGVGTCLCLRLYQKLAAVTPDREKALHAIRSFSQQEWENRMREIFGAVAPTIIEGEAKLWHKNDPEGHAERLDRIITHWDEIVQSIRDELPDADKTIDRLRALGIPTTPAEIGFDETDTVNAFIGSREIRNKYLSSSLMWDLGILNDFIGKWY